MQVSFSITQGSAVFGTKIFNCADVSDGVSLLVTDLAIVAASTRARGKKSPISSRSPFQVKGFALELDDTGAELSRSLVVDTSLGGNILAGSFDAGCRFSRSLAGIKRISRDVTIGRADLTPEIVFHSLEAKRKAIASHKAQPVAIG